MKHAIAALLSLLALPAHAELKVGDAAPDFSAPATLGGKRFSFSLAEALKEGPVVVYFYPAAFTSGCTVEAHLFAEAMPKFQQLGAKVIGVSSDDIATLDKFSVSECQSKFPVASDADHKIMKAYDAVFLWKTNYASRTSYLVTPDGKIAYTYTALSPDKHVANLLAAIQEWKAKGAAATRPAP